MIDESPLIAGVFRFPRLVLTRGEGTNVWDDEGRRYLDFTSGLGVAALGHGRKDLAKVLAAQFAKLGHCSNLYGNLPAVELATRLKKSSFADKIWFANSGAEANEAALKFARLFGRRSGGKGKTAIVSFRGGFHGRTHGALAATHHPAYRRPFTPLVPGMRFANFNDLADAARSIRRDVCAVLVEPVQGEGGVIAAEAGFLAGLRALCDANGALLVFDEVQCGMGRIGRLFAYERYGVMPDIVTLAKPLAGGLPLGAVLLNARSAGPLEPGHHGSTFSGGPAVCAVANRVFQTISRPDFLERVRAKEALLREGLESLAAGSTVFRAARGLGLMQALVIAQPRRDPPADFVRRAREHGLLVTTAGKDAVRLLPPLNCSMEEIDHAIRTLQRVAERRTAPTPPRPHARGDRPRPRRARTTAAR